MTRAIAIGAKGQVQRTPIGERLAGEWSQNHVEGPMRQTDEVHRAYRSNAIAPALPSVSFKVRNRRFRVPLYVPAEIASRMLVW